MKEWIEVPPSSDEEPQEEYKPLKKEKIKPTLITFNNKTYWSYKKKVLLRVDVSPYIPKDGDAKLMSKMPSSCQVDINERGVININMADVDYRGYLSRGPNSMVFKVKNPEFHRQGYKGTYKYIGQTIFTTHVRPNLFPLKFACEMPSRLLDSPKNVRNRVSADIAKQKEINKRLFASGELVLVAKNNATAEDVRHQCTDVQILRAVRACSDEELKGYNPKAFILTTKKAKAENKKDAKSSEEK